MFTIKNNKKTGQIKPMAVMLLSTFVVGILIFGTCIEVIGRREDVKEIKQHFTTVADCITCIHKTSPGKKLYDYLDYLLVRPYIEYIVYCENGDPEILYTNEKHIDFKKLNVLDEPKVDINMRNVSLEGYILLEDNAGKPDGSLYLGFSRDRNHGLLSGMVYKTLLSGVIIMNSIILLIDWIIYKRVYKPLEGINEFVDNLAVGKIPEDLEIDSPGMQGMVKSLYGIRQQLSDIKNVTGTVDEGVVLGILDIMEEIIRKNIGSDKTCVNITEIVCKKIEGAIGCSLWLGRSGGDTERPEACRKEAYYPEDQFPVKSLTPLIEALVKEVIQDRKIKIVNDFEADTDYKHFRKAYPLAVMVIPIQVGGKTIGGLCIWKSRIPYNETFNFKTLQLVGYVGRVIGDIVGGCDCVSGYKS